MSYTQTFDFNSNLMSNLLWQDDYPENIKGLMQKKEDWYQENLTDAFDNWIRDVFNIKTANRFGLVVWGIILGIQILPVQDVVIPFGFDQYNKNFENSNFLYIVGGSTGLLTLDEARRLLLVKYYSQTMSPTVGHINYMLSDVFGDLGISYVTESDYALVPPSEPPIGLDQYRENFFMSDFFFSFGGLEAIEPMSQTYHFLFPLRQVFLDALIDGVLPRGSGVTTYTV